MSYLTVQGEVPIEFKRDEWGPGHPPGSQRLWLVAAMSSVSSFQIHAGDHYQMTQGKRRVLLVRSGKKTHVSLGIDYNYAARPYAATRMESAVSPGRRGNRLGEEPVGLRHALIPQLLGISAPWAVAQAGLDAGPSLGS